MLTTEVGIKEEDWGELADGTRVSLYTLSNADGMSMNVSNYGGTITSLKAPDRNGAFADIVLGYDTLAEYLKRSPYFGAIIGRYSNRIASGRFELNGTTYDLARNNGPNSLHGGNIGFDKVVWNAETAMTNDGPQIILSRISPDGEEGYPGELTVKVIYTLTNTNELAIDYEAITTAPTPINLTQHSYFNLSGGDRDILGHVLEIDADAFTPLDETSIPTGEIRPVDGTPFDFRKPTYIGTRINADNAQIGYGRGYDHNWVLNGEAGTMRKVAVLSDPVSGRYVEVHTEEPGLQFYSGNFLDGSLSGKGVVYKKRSGLCLETQHFPNSPNQQNFPSTILEPGQTYATRTVFKFGAAN